jgi:hypothetical protein
MSDAATADITTISAAALGGPGRPDAAKCSIAAIEALDRVAGVDMAVTQMQIDVSSLALGQGEVAIHARIDKRTKSILFASVDAHAGDQMVFRAQALFSARR